MAIRVLIVDDHTLVRVGLIELISGEPDLEICGAASGVAEARKLAATTQPDVAIIDLTLKDGNGIELVKEFRERYGKLKLLVLSMHEESLFAERALRAGAVGYVSKDAASRTIIQAIRSVIAGNHYLSQPMTQRLVHQAVGAKSNGVSSPLERLTDREIEVFEMIGQGLTSRQIARRLELSPKTVNTYREHIKQKLELRNVTELTTHAVQWVLEKH
jgi:DNA-binding NarL/FixJ family response regulator